MKRIRSTEKDRDSMSSCQEALSAMHLHVEGELDPIRAHRLQAHLGHCEDCREARRELLAEKLWVMEMSLRAPELSQRFASKITRRIESHLASERRTRRRVRAAGLGSAAAALVVAAILLASELRRPDAASVTVVSGRNDDPARVENVNPRASSPRAPLPDSVAVVPHDPFFRSPVEDEHLALPAEEPVTPCANIDWDEDALLEGETLATSTQAPPRKAPRRCHIRDIIRVTAILGSTPRPTTEVRRGGKWKDRCQPNDVALLCQEVLLIAAPPEGFAFQEEPAEDDCDEPCAEA